MSLEKAIEHGKEKRKPYYRSKRFDMSCRPHGGCPWCYANRVHSTLKRIAIAEDTMYQEGVDIRCKHGKKYDFLL